MNWFFIVIGVVIASIVLGYIFFGGGQNIKNIPPKNNTVILFGDSLVEGIGSTDGNDLVSLLQKSSDKKFLNYGKSGDTTRDALNRVESVLNQNAGTIVIVLGGNDVLQKLPKEETFSNLEKMIVNFQNDGAAVVLVGVRSGVVGNGRDEDYKSVAEKTGSLYITDILQDVFGKRQYMSDTVHPNSAGYVIIAERILPIIESLFN